MTMQLNGLDFLRNVQLKKTLENDEIELSVFGRGFGECLVLGFKNKEYVIVDSFLNPDTKRPIAIDYLESMNISLSLIKRVVITHWHSDHISGIFQILELASEDVKIVLNPIVDNIHFNEFINLGIQEKKSSTSEFAKVYDFIQKRGHSCVKIANNDTRIYVNNDDETKVEIFSLSPQDEEIMNYIENIIEITTHSDTSLEYMDNNLLSIVLLIKFSNDGFLLGADLETTRNQNEGWNGVVNNYTHTETKSSVFKIPHHGSENGHNKLVWEKMLSRYPYSILTVYNKNTKLPKDNDIARIVNLSSNLFVIGNKSKHNKTLEHKLKKKMHSVKIEELSQDVGMVRYRKKIVYK